MTLTRPRGTADFLPRETARWRYVEDAARRVCRLYGYGEIRTPTFEETELFVRGTGETTDIVQREMYAFTDKGGRSLTLRPEGTPPVVRAYLENGLHSDPQPTKLFYIAPMFRYERPQAGRFREHHQFGVELFGSPEPEADAEVIHLALDFLTRLGLSGLRVRLNSIGCSQCREAYRVALREYLRPFLDDMCRNCQRRFADNPLRFLDCKREECRALKAGAPRTLDYLCAECRVHLLRLQEVLDLLGVDYATDAGLVRGLDYYTRTVFEIVHHQLGAQDAVCGGGRYDGLIEALGGRPTPGVGFGLGLERLLMVLDLIGAHLPEPPPLDAFVVTIGEASRAEGLRLMYELRAGGLSADTDYLRRSVKAQMRYAGKCPARYVLMLGEDEAASGRVTVREMETGRQEVVPRPDISSYLRRRAPARGEEELGGE